MPQARARIREALPNLVLGKWPTGALNSITDVPGVLVHTETLQPDRDINSGVTTILFRKDWHEYSCFAGVFSFNGCGEMTGSHWINDTGLLTSPIVLTTTSAIGDAYRGILDYCFRYCANGEDEIDRFILPVVAETFDGYLNNQSRFAVTPAHVVKGILNASADPVPEGNTGGGTGMICHRFKGGTGSSSRLIQGFDVDGKPKTYTIGALVQANYGAADNLHIGGIPVGRILKAQDQEAQAQAAAAVPKTGREPIKDGSIIIIIATDVPLLPVQLQRVAKRATVGLGKVGGYGANLSGDIFLAFSTAARISCPEMSMDPGEPSARTPYTPAAEHTMMSDNNTLNSVFEAAADATEEAIYNAMFMAESMTGFKGRHVDALDLERVKEIVNKRL
jgi:D-aminopeptidase